MGPLVQEQTEDSPRCVCGTVLDPRFIRALLEHPVRSYPCPNPACRYIHRFVPPDTLRTLLLSTSHTDERDTPIRGHPENRHAGGSGLTRAT